MCSVKSKSLRSQDMRNFLNLSQEAFCALALFSSPLGSRVSLANRACRLPCLKIANIVRPPLICLRASFTDKFFGTNVRDNINFSRKMLSGAGLQILSESIQ